MKQNLVRDTNKNKDVHFLFYTFQIISLKNIYDSEHLKTHHRLMYYPCYVPKNDIYFSNKY